jgi:hypothetical protein
MIERPKAGKSGMSKIIALWGVPRSVSSAFNQMMARRGDVSAHHEPFGEVYYYGEERAATRDQDLEIRPGLTYASVWNKLRKESATGIVFFKDFPFQMEPALTDELLDRCVHSFLIRDPAKTVESNFSKWPDINETELGFESQRRLFDRLCDRHGEPPPVIDAEELLDDTHGMLEAWCAAVGLPFVPEALNWESDKPKKVSWYDGDRFHDNLRASDGFKRQKRTYPPVASHPRMVELYLTCVPHYQALYAHRIGRSSASIG